MKINSNKAVTIDLVPETEVFVSPREFLEILETDPQNIVRSKFLPPRLGRHTFGSFKVELKRKRYGLSNVG